MAKLFQRLLAGVLASAAITGGTAAYVEAQPGGVYHARLPGLEAFAEKVPGAVRFDLMIARVNESALAESAGGELETYRDKPTLTADGCRVQLMANIA